MNRVWNTNGVDISEVTQNRWDDQQMTTIGTGSYQRPPASGSGPAALKSIASLRHFQWEATVNNRGWNVVIIGITGRLGEHQGFTFNLPLEVATAAMRLL
jgi:hypothetical protein